MRPFCGYGLASSDQAGGFAAAACDVLGHGANGGAVIMLLETAAQETHLGQFRDPTPDGAGRGLCQIDFIGFIDVIQRSRAADLAAIKSCFGMDLTQVEHDDLDFSPLLSMIICRLFYKLIPESFPKDLAGRAAYWKKYYNTYRGKGSVDEYIHNANRYL